MQNVSRKTKDYKRSIFFGALMGVSVALVFAAGFFFRDLIGFPTVLAGAASDDTNGYPLLDQVQTIIDQHFLREQPPATEREYAAIKGMLSSLNDRYTFFIDPPVAQSESQVLAGTYGGIGVLLQRNEAGQLILLPFPDSPAAKAGIENGDILTAINGTALDPATPQDQVDQMLRGEVKDNNGVEITVIKQSDGEDFTVFVPFDVINVPSVIWRVLSEDEQIGYVQIMRFTSRTPEELKTALDELDTLEVSALVVDLRNNSGGLLQESVAVADEFIDNGVMAYEQDTEGERTFDGTAGGDGADLPLAVLVNQGTASGAELVAGALQDYDRGPLIGQATYGKGTVQQIFPLADGSSVHVTAAEWFTPNHQQLSEHGLTPDIAMIPDATGRDVELGEAVRQLQQMRQPQD